MKLLIMSLQNNNFFLTFTQNRNSSAPLTNLNVQIKDVYRWPQFAMASIIVGTAQTRISIARLVPIRSSHVGTDYVLLPTGYAMGNVIAIVKKTRRIAVTIWVLVTVALVLYELSDCRTSQRSILYLVQILFVNPPTS